MGICDGILKAAFEAADEAGASKINSIEVTAGELTQIVDEALQFAFEVQRKGTIAEEASLVVTFLPARSKCLECSEEYGHGRYDVMCPVCGSFMAELVQGRELQIDNIDVD